MAGVAAVKVAVTEVAVFIRRVQVSVPSHPLPLQPLKLEPAVGAADKVTDVVLVYDSEQSVPQVIPAGLLVTVPCPLPLFATDSAKGTVGVEPQASSEGAESPAVL